jgi:hypothetical protein
MRFVNLPLPCALAGAVLMSAGGLPAQTPAGPDLSGTWILNIAKSDFDISDPKADTSTYTRSGNVYVVVQRGDGGRGTYQWPVGAGDVTCDLPEGAKMHTTTQLKGDTSTFTAEVIVKGVTWMIETGKEYLSPDGRVLTRNIIHQNLANPNEDALHFVFVYDKQQTP